ncbi:unnamed protein product [Trichobilharzia szidati]|nr:unnamed protein product [Trichobilharzia szidati]
MTMIRPLVESHLSQIHLLSVILHFSGEVKKKISTYAEAYGSSKLKEYDVMAALNASDTKVKLEEFELARRRMEHEFQTRWAIFYLDGMLG